MGRKHKTSTKRNKKGKRKFFKFYIVFLLIFWGVVLFTFSNGANINGSSIKDFFVDDTQYSEIIEQKAQKYNIDANLIRAVIFQESKFDSQAVGKAGEIGLMQLVPAAAVADWARVHAKEPPNSTELFDPALNIEIGSWYLSLGLNKYKDHKESIILALCAYNAGDSRANKWRIDNPDESVLENIPIDSTKNYVDKVMTKYLGYSKETKEQQAEKSMESAQVLDK